MTKHNKNCLSGNFPLNVWNGNRIKVYVLTRCDNPKSDGLTKLGGTNYKINVEKANKYYVFPSSIHNLFLY